MEILSPDKFWNLLWSGEKSVQRGLGHTERRTPRFSIVAPLSRFGRRVLRTIFFSIRTIIFILAAPFQEEGRGAKHSPSLSKLSFIVIEINIFQFWVSGHIGDSDSHTLCFGQNFAASGRISMKLRRIVNQINTK